MYRSAVLLLLLDVKMAMFFLCTVERHSIIKSVFFGIRLKVIRRKLANQMKVQNVCLIPNLRALNSNKWQRIRYEKNEKDS